MCDERHATYPIAAVAHALGLAFIMRVQGHEVRQQPGAAQRQKRASTAHQHLRVERSEEKGGRRWVLVGSGLFNAGGSKAGAAEKTLHGQELQLRDGGGAAAAASRWWPE
jgi:hypothetical protein